MMVVSNTGGGTFSGGRPQEFWRGHYSHGMNSSCGVPWLTSSNYDVTPNGQRFLMIRDDDVGTASAGSVIVVLGFAQEVSRHSA